MEHLWTNCLDRTRTFYHILCKQTTVLLHYDDVEVIQTCTRWDSKRDRDPLHALPVLCSIHNPFDSRLQAAAVRLDCAFIVVFNKYSSSSSVHACLLLCALNSQGEGPIILYIVILLINMHTLIINTKHSELHGQNTEVQYYSAFQTFRRSPYS